MLNYRPTAKFDKDASVVLLDTDQVKKNRYPVNDKKLKEQIKALAGLKQFTGEDGQVFPVLFNNKIVLLVGVGKKEGLSLTTLRTNLRNVLLSTYLNKAKSVEIIFNEQKDAVIKAVIEGVLLGTYSFKKYKTENKGVQNKVYFFVCAKKKAFTDCEIVCQGTNLARDLINENADVANSAYLEKVIKDLVKGKKKVSVDILNSKELKAKGLNFHLAVNRGSKNEPKLIIVKYNGSLKKSGYTALVGKGLTFDTGGLNLKPSGGIETMKLDMSGAAAVIGALKNVLDLKLNKNILFAVGLAENAIDAQSYKPGDVVKGYAGKTVEVANTDAEGRLVLADAISYVVKNYKPSKLIDIATLTGACIVALGYDYTGLVTQDDHFSRQLIRSSNETDDRLWRLPSYPELKDHVKSNIADIRNLGLAKGAAGTISAAEFLRQFADGTTWAHFDIAGTSFVEGTNRWYYGHGATGAGVRILTHYLAHN